MDRIKRLLRLYGILFQIVFYIPNKENCSKCFIIKTTHTIIGSSMNVLGSGFQEVIYQRCLALELEKAAIHYVREIEMPIFYDGVQVGTRRADFIIDKKIMTEIKAVIQ